MSTTTAAGGYAATIGPDGVMTVRDVPIFVECERNGTVYDAAWIDAVVAKAKQAEREGYLPPLHIRHHDADPEAQAQVRASGFFRVTGTRVVTFKGERKLAVLADLVVTDHATQQEILSKRLPYRSVELLNGDQPTILSLALLDHEAPFLQLPMLMVAQVQRDPNGVADATLQVTTGATVAASFRHGTRAALLFRAEDQHMADEKKTDEKKTEKMADGAALDVAAIVKAISEGSISVADMDKILAAIKDAEGKKTSEPDGDEGKGAAAPVPSVPGTSMKADSDLAVQFGALKGELEATRAAVQKLQTEKASATFIAASMRRLEGRVIGADFEQELTRFYAQHGETAAKAMVDQAAKMAPQATGVDARAQAFADQSKGLVGFSEEVLKFQSQGPDALAKAAKFSANWKELHSRGFTRMTEAAYLAANMSKGGN